MRTRKLTAKQLYILAAAKRHGIVPGGVHATFRQAFALIALGLLARTVGAYTLTDKGIAALESGVL